MVLTYVESELFWDSLRFKGQWRDYQGRVLGELGKHLEDDHLHIVAAPGSGKTVLGIEVMGRLRRPTLILAPTLPIRNQWLQRIAEMFLPDGFDMQPWISTDIYQPKLVTIVTYQGLHAALGKKKSDTLFEDLKGLGLGALILDEAHHLRNEWWKTLIATKKTFAEITVVSLTATPPYDVEYSEWQRYHEMCGAIDAEISVPELVKINDLCPHQDYVYFSSPTAYEQKILTQFKRDVQEFALALKTNEPFINMIAAHPWLAEPETHVEEILNDPAFCSSMIIFLHYLQWDIPEKTLAVLGVSQQAIPALTLAWLEILFQGIFYKYAKGFEAWRSELNRLEKALKEIGAIEKRKVRFKDSEKVKKLLAFSLSKLDSIRTITQLESDTLKTNLRMVILTDYIRKSDLPTGDQEQRPIDKIGAVPLFETLRRSGIDGIKLGILTGSLIFIPAESEMLLWEIANRLQIDRRRIQLQKVSFDANYVQLTIRGEVQQRIVHLITELFGAGGITVLIGTQALLGEGWDAPSVNVLVLASYVGSYMLSNQMRGRAIRIDQRQPEKVANIWHLVALNSHAKGEARSRLAEIDWGDDYRMLQRRFAAFEGLSYNDPLRIENGFQRLGLSSIDWDSDNIEKANSTIRMKATDRARLTREWFLALESDSANPMMVEQVESGYLPKGFAVSNAIGPVVWRSLALVCCLIFGLGFFWSSRWSVYALAIIAWITFIRMLPKSVRLWWILIRQGRPAQRMALIAKVILRAMEDSGQLSQPRSRYRVICKKLPDDYVCCRLKGASTLECSRFLDGLEELLSPVENPRYLLLQYGDEKRKRVVDCCSVPVVCGQNKKDAEGFKAYWNKTIGPADIVFTRNAKGRRLLLQARHMALTSMARNNIMRLSVWE